MTLPAIYEIKTVLRISVFPTHQRFREAPAFMPGRNRNWSRSGHLCFSIYLMVTPNDQPVECFLTHGGFGNVDALKCYTYELPDGSVIYADKAYNDYETEDILNEIDNIKLTPMRKKNSKRALSQSICFVQNYHCKMVETTGSLIAQLLPKSMHAVTALGFELKVVLFMIAYSIVISNSRNAISGNLGYLILLMIWLIVSRNAMEPTFL